MRQSIVCKFDSEYVAVIGSGKMIGKLVWCLFLSIVLSGNNCSPTERDLYAFSTIANEVQSTTQAEDSETAETNTYSNYHGSEDVGLENSEEDPPGPPDHVIPYSEHENPGEVPTKPKYVAPGLWAKPDPKKNIPLDFVPTKSLAQVRGTHTVKVLPQSEALASATSEEERENAPRLREVVSKKKTNTIYTEEGYEDSAYDHAGHIRDADFHEGYARKLHDERRSKARSGGRKKKKSKKKKKSNYEKPRNNRAKEFEEFSDDYSDTNERNEKYEAEGSSTGSDRIKNSNKIYNDEWKRPEVNPKIVTENEIEKLERDLQREAEEAEKGSENYGSGTDRNIPQNYNDEDTNSKENDNRRPSYETKDRFYNENYETTTIQFETPEKSRNYDGPTSAYENPTTNRYYVPDGSVLEENYEATTFNYYNPRNPQPVLNDAPTTMNYGQLFWQYYKEKPEQTTIQEPNHLLRETTTLQPFADQTPPVALATINGHGPYLFVSESSGVTQNPNEFSYYQNGHQSIDPSAIFDKQYENFLDSQVIKSRSGQNWGFENVGETTTKFYDSFGLSSTPIYPTIEQPSNNYETSGSIFQTNPFFNSVGDSSRYRNGNPNLSRSKSKSKSHVDEDLSFFSYTPNLGYSKMLNFIESQQKNRYGGKKSESVFADDFTIMKPPPPPPLPPSFSDFTVNSYPNVAGYSSVAQESEAREKANRNRLEAGKNNAKSMRKDINSKYSNINGNNAALLSKSGKKLFPASKLLPPPANSQVMNYGDQNFGNRNVGNRVNDYRPDLQQLTRYLNNRKTPSRQVRSLEEEAKVTKEIDARSNFTFEDQRSEKRAKGNLIPEINSSVTDERLVPTAKYVLFNEKRIKRNHENLLDASHKIAGDVVDEEIKSRFNEKDYDEDEEEDEDEDEEEREKIVQVDIPDLDYLDEIQDVNEIKDIPTTTIATIDMKKYPFYKNAKVPNSSPLKYIINPKQVPRKTFGGMEFYDSRDKYAQCDELDPNLDEVLPDEEEPAANKGPVEGLPRLRGLGDKLDCFKAKYFGQNPFDNPLFFEKKISQPTPPTELDPMKFASRILELPEENRVYFIPAKSRKPENLAARRMDDGKNRNKENVTTVKPLSDVRNKIRSNNNRDQTKESTIEKPETGRRRSRRRRPTQRLPTTTTTTESSNIVADSVTPYEKEVYEDVMGTIKNLASLYEMFGAQTPPSPLTEATIVSPQIGSVSNNRNLQNNLNRVKTSNLKRENEGAFHEEIEGLVPPPELNTKPKLLPYRTNKVSYNIRARTENPLRNNDKKIVRYFRTVMVHKRSLDDESKSSVIRPNEHTVKKRSADSSSSTTVKPNRGRRRKTNLSTTTTTTTELTPVLIDAEKETRRSYYPIRSRSKNSKDEESSSSRHGLFTTTERSSTVTDGRRNEPRYTEIMRRRGQTTTTSTTSSPKESFEIENHQPTAIPSTNESFVEQATESEEIYESEDSVSSEKKVDDIVPSATGLHFGSEEAEENDEESENYEEDEEDEGGDEDSTVKPEKVIRNYDVHEDVQEDTTPSTAGVAKPSKPSEFLDLETYLRTDPPGFSEAFVSDPGTTVSHFDADGSDDKTENYANQESKEDRVEDDDDEEEAERSSHHEEESSDDDATGSPKSLESYRESSNDNSDDSEEDEKKSEQVDNNDMTFFRFDSRPNSPFESFEDEKYSELGPRINKPAFYHPPFEAPKYERHYFDDSEEEKEDKTGGSSEFEKYVFPWAHDEEDEKAEAEESFGEQVTEKYEYPWDKRERLAEERARRRKDRERLRKLRAGIIYEDEDDEDEGYGERSSSSETRKKSTYPWDVYDVPSKEYKMNFRNNKNDKIDSDETSSEHRPVAKFSSKYSSSRFKLPFAGSDPITTADPKEIRNSVLKYLKNADTDQASMEPTIVADETEAPTTEEAEEAEESTTQLPKSLTTTQSSKSTSSNRLSNSRIIPEDITNAPRTRNNRNRVTPVRPRTTLRPAVVKPTTENVAVEQTTEATIVQTTRRSASRLRGRPSYGAVESRISSTTVRPNHRLTVASTTARSVDSSTRIAEKNVIRKRGKVKTVPPTVRQSDAREDVAEKSTTATTTTTSRRKTRPTKTVDKNEEKHRKSSLVDEKNYDDDKISSTSLADFKKDALIEDSTPASRTVEHRSRVSKESIITKTSYPERDFDYKINKDKSTLKKKINPFEENSDNVSSTNRKLEKSYAKTSDRARNSFAKNKSAKENPLRNESVESLSITTKETPEHVYEKKEILDKDGHKGMYLTITAKNHSILPAPSAFEDEQHLKEAAKEDEDFGFYEFDDRKTLNAESNGDFGNTLAKDISVLDDLLRKIPPRSEKYEEDAEDATEETATTESTWSQDLDSPTPSYNEEEKSDGNKEIHETEEKMSTVKFEKDPSRRLYYYVDDKK